MSSSDADECNASIIEWPLSFSSLPDQIRPCIIPVRIRSRSGVERANNTWIHLRFHSRRDANSFFLPCVLLPNITISLFKIEATGIDERNRNVPPLCSSYFRLGYPTYLSTIKCTLLNSPDGDEYSSSIWSLSSSVLPLMRSMSLARHQRLGKTTISLIANSNYRSDDDDDGSIHRPSRLNMHCGGEFCPVVSPLTRSLSLSLSRRQS